MPKISSGAFSADLRMFVRLVLYALFSQVASAPFEDPWPVCARAGRVSKQPSSSAKIIFFIGLFPHRFAFPCVFRQPRSGVLTKSGVRYAGGSLKTLRLALRWTVLYNGPRAP